MKTSHTFSVEEGIINRKSYLVHKSFSLEQLGSFLVVLLKKLKLCKIIV